jgi:hypothetical protein
VKDTGEEAGEIYSTKKENMVQVVIKIKSVDITHPGFKDTSGDSTS